MMPITFIKGDATLPRARGPKIIAHVCNNLGRWGKGFVMAISSRWREPEKAYREWSTDQKSFRLGSVQFVQVEADIWIANMVGQHRLHSSAGEPPIRYAAVEDCLGRVAVKAKELGASVHMPRIGCGLAGGQWEAIEPLIIKTLCDQDVPGCGLRFLIGSA
jgi:O-acetyl-ADP-ribose deacetylase (regulator of RNase III)